MDKLLKRIKDLTDEEKGKLCDKYCIKCDDECPLNFKDSKEYGRGYFMCWADVTVEHIKNASSVIGKDFVNQILEDIYDEQEGDKEIEIQ